MSDLSPTTRPLRRDPLVASIFIACGLLATSWAADATAWPIFIALCGAAGGLILVGLYVLGSAVVRVLSGRDEMPD